jgi:hypothetical protein
MQKREAGEPDWVNFHLLGGCLLLGIFCKRRCANHWATFSHSTRYVLIFRKHGLGYILGDFFANSSGHPEGKQTLSSVYAVEIMVRAKKLITFIRLESNQH